MDEKSLFEFFAFMRINNLGQKLIDVIDPQELKDSISVFCAKSKSELAQLDLEEIKAYLGDRIAEILRERGNCMGDKSFEVAGYYLPQIMNYFKGIGIPKTEGKQEKELDLTKVAHIIQDNQYNPSDCKMDGKGMVNYPLAIAKALCRQGADIWK